MKREFDITRKLYLREYKFDFNTLNLDLKPDEIGFTKYLIKTIEKNQIKLKAYVQAINILENENLTKVDLKNIITKFQEQLNYIQVVDDSLKLTINLLIDVYTDRIPAITLKEFDEGVKSTFLINTMDNLSNLIENIEIHRIFSYIETTEISANEIKEAIKSSEIIDILGKIKDLMYDVNNYEYFDYDLTVYNLEKPNKNGEEIARFSYQDKNDYDKQETAYLYYTTYGLVDAFTYMGILKVLQSSANGRKIDLLKKFNKEKNTVNIFASKKIMRLSKLRELYSSKNVIIFVYLANALNLTKKQSSRLSRKLKLNNPETFKTKFDEFQNILFPNNKYLQ